MRSGAGGGGGPRSCKLLPSQPALLRAEDAALEDERIRLVRQALAGLPDGQREVVELHRLQQLSFPEIADVLGEGVEAVKSRAFRGYKALKILLAELQA